MNIILSKAEAKKDAAHFEVRIRKAQREIKRLQEEIVNCGKWKKKIKSDIKKGFYLN